MKNSVCESGSFSSRKSNMTGTIWKNWNGSWKPMQLFRQRRFVHILNPLEVHNGFPVSSCCFSPVVKTFLSPI